MHEYTAEVAKVVEGDSIWLVVDVGFRITHRCHFRLNRIVTPGIGSDDSEDKIRAFEAKERLAELLPVGSKVQIKTSQSSRKGKWLVEIWNEDPCCSRNVNDLLLEEGHAVHYERHQ